MQKTQWAWHLFIFIWMHMHPHLQVYSFYIIVGLTFLFGCCCINYHQPLDCSQDLMGMAYLSLSSGCRGMNIPQFTVIFFSWINYKCSITSHIPLDCAQDPFGYGISFIFIRMHMHKLSWTLRPILVQKVDVYYLFSIFCTFV